MIPLIQNEIVYKKKWLAEDDILEIIAIAESTPGPIAVNSATFTGYRTAGFFGAFAATLGVVLPSFTIIYILSFVIRQFENIHIVKYAFTGIRAGIFALLINALLSMYRQCPKNVFSYIIMTFAFISVAFFRLNILTVIIICAVLGIISAAAAERKCKK